MSFCAQLSRKAAAKFFCDRFPGLQRRYSRYLHLLILFNIMQSTIQHKQTGKMWLVSSRLYDKMKDQINAFRVQSVHYNMFLHSALLNYSTALNVSVPLSLSLSLPDAGCTLDCNKECIQRTKWTAEHRDCQRVQ